MKILATIVSVFSIVEPMSKVTNITTGIDALPGMVMEMEMDM
jgi:hypothetical protein